MVAWNQIAEQIGRATGDPFEGQAHHLIGGGSINTTYHLEGVDGRSFFIKTNSANRLAMFEAEIDGLRELQKQDALRIPEPICSGVAETSAYLIMQNIPLGFAGSQVALGEGLAAMHRIEASRFGWHRDNTIGSTPQLNHQGDNWVDFWRQQRLGYQLQLAKENGASSVMLDQGERLMAELDKFFGGGYAPTPSLLHGDLWSGNYDFNELAEPVIFDPALYYGDREAELAMTELFGGFSREFYRAYSSVWPLDQGYTVRKVLYNLYHILNHFNMFGGDVYAAQADDMIGHLLKEIH